MDSRFWLYHPSPTIKLQLHPEPSITMGLIVKFAEFIRWYPQGMSAEERRLVFKVDCLVSIYACLSFFTKYLDVSALSKSNKSCHWSSWSLCWHKHYPGNAYVSGMKEDLHLTGNRSNYINGACKRTCPIKWIKSILLTLWVRLIRRSWLCCFSGAFEYPDYQVPGPLTIYPLLRSSRGCSHWELPLWQLTNSWWLCGSLLD